MSKIKDENYIVIQGWMINHLNLKGNDLLIYALIYGFSQDGETQFVGSLNYIADFACCDKSTAKRSLKRLIDAGLIIKEPYEINNVVFNRYRAQCTGWEQNDPTGGGKMHPNNNIDKNIIKETSIPNGIDKESPKKRYGTYDNVRLTEKECAAFKSECPEADRYIERLSEYMAMKGTSYKNHLAALRNWYRRDSEKVPEQKQGNSFMDELAAMWAEEDAKEGNNG